MNKIMNLKPIYMVKCLHDFDFFKKHKIYIALFGGIEEGIGEGHLRRKYVFYRIAGKQVADRAFCPSVDDRFLFIGDIEKPTHLGQKHFEIIE